MAIFGKLMQSSTDCSIFQVLCLSVCLTGVLALSPKDAMGPDGIDAANIPEEDVLAELDIWPNDPPLKITPNLLHAAPASEWAALTFTCIFMVVTDIWIISRWRDPKSMKSNVLCLMFPIAVAFIYLCYYGRRYGSHDMLEWGNGWLLEWLLSMDNLFIFHLIFKSYKTPCSQTGKCLAVGIISCVVLRAIFFLTLCEALEVFHPLNFFFGGLLIYSGVSSIYEDDDDDDDEEGEVKESYIISGLKFCMGDRIKNEYDHRGANFFVYESGKFRMTLLGVVLVLIEASDILFAIDSVTAKVAQIDHIYTAFSSTVLAMFSLRAMYFVLEAMTSYFDMLKYGISAVIIFIGVELCISPWAKLSSTAAFIIILSMLAVSLVASLIFGTGGEDEDAKGKDEFAKEINSINPQEVRKKI